MEIVREARAMDEEEHELIVIRDGEMEVVENPNADDLAEEVQMQELLFFLLQPQEHEHEGLESPQESIEEPIEELIIEPIDPKGKQQVEFVASYITEKGECSRILHENFNCPICMELIPTSDGFNINPCDHIFCISCMIHYITVKTEENAVTIPCPIPGCESTFLDPETCQHILPKDTFERWNLTLCESSLGPNKFYCPFKDCSALLIDEEGESEKITNSECPHCNRMFCAKCKVPWHGDMSCEEYERLGEDERGREDLLLRNMAKDKRWQRCPKCRMYVERIDGCAFMKCRCGNCFCYVCATPMSSATHYCEKCKR
ncbi:E3 ubiquitin-protein ligase RSL1-like isoform X2 [Carex rostrata]